MEARSKQACEPCRAEKNDLHGRFQALESHVKNIYQLLQPQAEAASSSSPGTSMRDASMGLLDENGSASPVMMSDTVAETTFSTTNPHPPPDVLDHLIDTYRIRHHLQPLQLFKLPNLKRYLASAPRFLFESFLALTVRYSTHDFYQSQELQAVEHYASSAQQAVTSIASQGIPKLEVIQALCLLGLVDVAACKPGRAWMTIGTLSRLEGLRKISQQGLIESSSDPEACLRCRWTVFLLEQTFMPQERTSVHDDDQPKYPTSAPIPPSLPPITDGEYPPDLYSDDATEDLGITAYYVKILGIWGHMSSYMHQIRIGKAQTAWSAGSMHYELCAQLYEYDAKTPHIHLLRSVHFTKRQSSELIERREYWIPWVLQQVTSHATTAIVNHPFVHLVAMRDRLHGLPPRQFLQQTVDLAMYHSAWVFKFLRFCEEQNFGIYDPLVGHLVAVVSTIPWLFQRAIDPKIAQKARDDLTWCKGFLERLSATWPHIAHKLELLNSLDTTAGNNPQSPSAKGVSIVFHPSLFWALVDPKISQMTPSLPHNHGFNRFQDGTIRVSTHYIQPLVESQVEPSHQIGDLHDPFSLDIGALEHINLDDVFASFLPTLDETY
ncbi:unnamed protein product [Fusarium equiseti]|uniref:Transcription factor domain-containing protein n=1 Tax=Fusarium equiseti TaxID=61235 RepID=A0A8J2IJ03_FUSEQ|nr:unnamed protein product [Fusarium equiseti]